MGPPPAYPDIGLSGKATGTDLPVQHNKHNRERERELRREGGKSLLAYVKGVDPHLKHIDRPTTIRSPEHRSGWVNYPPAYVIWVDGCVARTAGRGDVPYDV